MVPVGDVEKFTNQLIQLLQLDTTAYTGLSQNCLQVAQTFSWSKIAKEHLEVYSKFLEN